MKSNAENGTNENTLVLPTMSEGSKRFPCDDCYKHPAEMHMGDGIFLCPECMRHYRRDRVVEKMKNREYVLERLADGEYVPFDLLKTVPVELLVEYDYSRH